MTPELDNWAARQEELYGKRRRILRDVIFKTIAPLLWKIHVTGVENIPADGPVILMMNHMSALDPAWAMAAVPHRFVVPMTKIENMRTPGIGHIARLWGAYTINREQVDRQALKTAIDLMAAGEATLIAPEGTRSPALIPAKHGLAYIAIKTNAVIVPLAIYNSEGWNRDLAIPWRRTPLQMRYGPAFKLRTNERKRIPRDEMAQMSHEMMYQVAQMLPEKNRGYYADLSQMTTATLEFI